MKMYHLIKNGDVPASHLSFHGGIHNRKVIGLFHHLFRGFCCQTAGGVATVNMVKPMGESVNMTQAKDESK